MERVSQHSTVPAATASDASAASASAPTRRINGDSDHGS